MADVTEILNYQGNPDLAFGSNALPAGSNAEIVDTSPAIKYWQQYAQNKYNFGREQIDALNKKRKEVQDAIGSGNYKVWDADRVEFKKKHEEWSKAVVDVAKRGKWGDIQDPDYEKALVMQNELEKFSQFSLQQNKDYDTVESAYRLHPEIFPDNFSEVLIKYRDGGVDYRAQNTLTIDPQISADAVALATKLKELPGLSKEVVTSSKDEYGRYVDVTERVYDPEKIKSGVAAQYSADKKIQRGWDDAFAALPLEEQMNYENSVGYASATVFDLLNGGNKTRAKNPFYAPADVRNPLTVEYQTDIPENVNVATSGYKVMKITDKNKNVIFKVKDANGNDVQLKKSDGTPITNSFKTQSNAEIALNTSGGTETIRHIGGWYYSGVADFPSNININAPQRALDYNNNMQLSEKDIGTSSWHVDVLQVVDKYVNKKTGKILDADQITDANIGNYNVVRMAKVKRDDGKTFDIPYTDNIKVSLEQALRKAKLSIKAPPVGTPEETQTQKAKIRVSLNGKIGEIPADQWEAFKKKYPNAVKQ